eukprot:1285045-Ditylum_brightwellii.AAC.1
MLTYVIYRDDVEIDSISSTTNYADRNVELGNIYEYSVRADDGNGHTSKSSNTLRVTIPSEALPSWLDVTAPTKPGDLRVVNAAPTEVTLQWDESSDDKGLSGYEVFVGTRHPFSLYQEYAFVRSTSFKIQISSPE